MREGRRQKLKTAAEWDFIGSWRRYYCYLQHAGVKKWIKRSLNKRWRKELNMALRTLKWINERACGLSTPQPDWV